jgi:ferredoxin
MGNTTSDRLPVSVDRDLCIGTGDCARLAPLAFRVSDRDFVSEVLPGSAATDPALLREAAAACPVEAILLVAEARPDALGAMRAGA